MTLTNPWNMHSCLGEQDLHEHRQSAGNHSQVREGKGSVIPNRRYQADRGERDQVIGIEAWDTIAHRVAQGHTPFAKPSFCFIQLLCWTLMDADEPLKPVTTPEVFTKRDLICCSGPSGQDQEVEISEPFASLVALSFASPCRDACLPKIFGARLRA